MRGPCILFVCDNTHYVKFIITCKYTIYADMIYVAILVCALSVFIMLLYYGMCAYTNRFNKGRIYRKGVYM